MLELIVWIVLLFVYAYDVCSINRFTESRMTFFLFQLSTNLNNLYVWHSYCILFGTKKKTFNQGYVNIFTQSVIISLADLYKDKWKYLFNILQSRKTFLILFLEDSCSYLLICMLYSFWKRWHKEIFKHRRTFILF